ncbi:MAG: hypothetical protein H6838_13405 [Planctomycetes bacterium]|nr:hypothetical protein [Planctomycetota bacterium]MCB9886487.1 hypothetical protein [Planctomycetota bacterium]
MEDDLFVDAACPASDLAARLFAELTRAEGELARVEELFAAAAAVASATHAVPFPLHRERLDRLQHVSGIRAVLADLTNLSGDRHAATA